MAFEDSDIYQAILDGDLAALGCSVGEQDVNLRDNSGKSYLHICIELGQKELVEYLAQKVFLGFRDDNGHTALDLATRYRMTEVEQQLIRRVAGMQDSDDTQALVQLFQAGWRAWPPTKPLEDPEEAKLPPGYHCQMEILLLQKQVEKIHQAVQDGNLAQLQDALTEESLVLVCDNTGLPPLQKAVLFEWLSVAQYISRGFPRAVNHPDHMGRTALHYAAAYHEYQDNILYKQLIRAGANEDVSDLVGFRPTDFLMDASLFSIDQMREDVKSRLSRPPKDYSHHMSYEESRNLPCHQTTTSTRIIKRWRTIASVASFAHNNKRKLMRCKPFEETDLYESIITNDVRDVRYLLSRGEDVSQHSVEGWSYLHLAVAHHVSPPLLSLLLTQISPAERDFDGRTPFELAMLHSNNSTLAEVLLNTIVGLILRGDVTALQGLAQDGWQYWPDEEYVDRFLQSEITPHMTQLLSSVHQFMSDVREVHKAATLHQELDVSLSLLLDTEAGVTSLDSVGLSLAHICVIFYNIKLLTRLLHDFPFIANIKDSMCRSPLHYAAGLDDEDYMYTLLKAVHAREDEEDLWGMRPGDYMTDRNRIVSPCIQETIRDRLHQPSTLKPPWPTCLLSARMESSKVYEAIKAGDVDTLETLLADPSTDAGLRDSQGRGFLHHAILTGADLPVLKALADRVDIAARDSEGKTALDLSESGSHWDAVREAVEGKVKKLILEAGEEGETEALRLLLAGWSHWPVTAEEAKEKSEEAAQLLEKVTELKGKVAEVHKAVQSGNTNNLKGLLDRKTLAEAADQKGLPPLHKAVLFQRQEPLEYIISEFPDTLNAKDNMGRTALHYAAVLTDEGNLYKTLKDAGADETVMDLLGKTPTDYQQQPDALPIADILKKFEDTTAEPASVQQSSSLEQTADDDATQLNDTSKPEETAAPSSQQPKTPTPPPPAEPPKPAQVTPVHMYIPNPTRERAPPPTTVDGKYVAQHLGAALTMALAEIAEKRPWDPIEYLGQWLYKYRQNLDEVAQNKELLEEIRCEEEAANKEEIAKFQRQEEMKRIQEEEERRRQEEEEARKKREQEELQRQAKEAILAQKPQLPTVTEEEVEDTMFRERDVNGQTELHILAAESGADLVALSNLGYSLADRDASNRTPRDVAEEQGLTENVEAFDNYVGNLLEQEKLETLVQLVMESYDKLDEVLQKVSTEGLPESVTDFVNSIPKLQEQVAATFRAVSSGVAKNVENALERKSLALAKDEYGRSPLHLAMLAGHNEIAQNIVNNFPLSIKTRDNLNRTPLHYAAALSEEMEDFLKVKGADTNAKDALQHIPTYYKDEPEEILKLKTTLPSPVTADTEDTNDAQIPQIVADDDNQPEEDKENEAATEQSEQAPTEEQ